MNWNESEEDAVLGNEKIGSPVREQEAVIDEASVSALSAGQVAKAFLNAGSEKERFAFVRSPETVLPGWEHSRTKCAPIPSCTAP